MYTLQELAQKAKKTHSAAKPAVQDDAMRNPDNARPSGQLFHADSAGDSAEAVNTGETVSPYTAAARPLSQARQLPEISLADLIHWLLRYWLLIALCTLIGIAAGIAYGITAKPRFTAYSDIMVAPSNLQLIPNDVYATNLQAESQLMDIESKLRLLTSVNVLQRAVNELKLQENSQFNGTQTAGLLGGIFNTSQPVVSSDSSEEAKNLSALRELSTRLDARRPERSYLINLSAWGQNPEEAVKLANAVAKSFQEEVTQNEQEGAARAARALTEPLNELKLAATEAEAKVAQFRSAQGLQTSAGELVSTQSLTQINTQLIAALTRQAEAKSRYDELTTSTANQLAPSASLQSATLTALRTQYATLRQRIDAMAMTYGPLYPELVSAQSQLAGLERQIAQETSRILRAAKLDLDQATSVVESLRQQTAGARSAVSLDNDAQVTLNDLERDMTAKITIYQTYLNRAEEIAQRQQIDATNIRIVSTALPPKSRSWPPRTVLLAIGGAMTGGGLGVTLAMILGFSALLRRQNREDLSVRV